MPLNVFYVDNFHRKLPLPAPAASAVRGAPGWAGEGFPALRQEVEVPSSSTLYPACCGAVHEAWKRDGVRREASLIRRALQSLG
jgi:hypothetical protein